MCVSPQVPGNVQPDTPMFKAPGDYEIRTKEINNGVCCVFMSVCVCVCACACARMHGDSVSHARAPS